MSLGAAPRKVAEAVLWAVAIGAVAGLWLFPDAISRLRAMGAPYAEADVSCSLAAGPCQVRFDDGTVVTMTASPQPAGPEDAVTVHVEVAGASTPTALEIQGVEMAMGFLRLPFEPVQQGWALTATLPVCTTERMLWKADVVLDDRVAGFFLVSHR